VLGGGARPALSYFVVQVTLDIPDELCAGWAAPRRSFRNVFLRHLLSKPTYREHNLSTNQLRRLLGFETRHELDGFLKAREIWLEYGIEDLERNRKLHRQLGL